MKEKKRSPIAISIMILLINIVLAFDLFGVLLAGLFVIRSFMPLCR